MATDLGTDVRREQLRQRKALENRSSQRSQPRYSGGHKGWSPELEMQYQQYRRAPHGQRQLIWLEWTKEEKRLVYCVSNHTFQAEQRAWKQCQLEHQQKRFPSLEGSPNSQWLHDPTQDGDVEHNPGPAQQQQQQQQQRKCPASSKSGQKAAPQQPGRQNRRQGPKPKARQAQAARALPGNREPNVTYNNKSVDNAEHCSHCGQKTLVNKPLGDSDYDGCFSACLNARAPPMHVPWFHAPPPFPVPPWWNGLCPYPMVASRPPDHNSLPLCCLHWPPLSYADAVRCGTANSPSVSHSRDAFWYPTSPVPCMPAKPIPQPSATAATRTGGAAFQRPQFLGAQQPRDQVQATR